MPSNQAAYLTAKGVRSLAVREAPYFSPDPDYVTIKNRALAVNPTDAGVQDLGLFIAKWPHILGCDVAGIIEEVGINVTHVKPGDRVIAMVAMTVKPGDDGSFATARFEGASGAGGFQLYSVAEAKYVEKLPDNVSFEEGSVLPLAMLTSLSALCLAPMLGLELPSTEAKDRGEYVLIWGGASSVGSCAIQLAINSGYGVITTCSSHNIEYCEKLGAEKAFDYKVDSVVDSVVDYLNGKSFAGVLDAISYDGTTDKCVQIAQKVEGTKKIIAVRPGLDKDHPDGVSVRACMGHMTTAAALKSFAEFLPNALESGKIKAKPDPLVVGKGLESAQDGLNAMRDGVSARKVVISI